jgi:hypothetical protein
MKPSVTKLIDMLDKPALLKWANKIGLEGIKLDDYRSKSKDAGSSIHEQVEHYLKFGILTEDQALNDRIVNFFSDKQIIDIEKSIECEYFIGRFDVKLKWKDFIFICDFKSNSKVYFETKLQLAAYKMAEECDHVAVIHLPDFTLRPVDLYYEHYEFIKTLSKLFELRYKLENSI